MALPLLEVFERCSVLPALIAYPRERLAGVTERLEPEQVVGPSPASFARRRPGAGARRRAQQRLDLRAQLRIAEGLAFRGRFFARGRLWAIAVAAGGEDQPAGAPYAQRLGGFVEPRLVPPARVAAEWPANMRA